jgi:hypothetical protein
MFKTVANFVLEALRRVVSVIAVVVAYIGVKLTRGEKGPYSVVPVLLAPIVVLHFLGLGRNHDQ